MKSLLSIIFCLMVCSAFAQKDLSIRVSTGYATQFAVEDGYYFNFNVGIPVIRSIEIAPSFTYASMLPGSNGTLSWNSGMEIPSTGTPIGGPKKEVLSGSNVGSIDILVLFKPFDLLKNEKLSKHELAIGAGYGFKSYTSFYKSYKINGDDHELTNFSFKTNQAFDPYYGKMMYSYQFCSKFTAGAAAGLNGFDGEAMLNFGLQLGVKL